MAINKSEGRGCGHSAGCGCKPSFFVNMIENAGLELSRRDFIKGAGAFGGMLALGGLSSSALATSPGVSKGAKAEVIYHGGPIVTMTKDGDRAESLAVLDGRIMAVGPLEDVMANKGPDTKVVDLGGKILMPGFFDPHSHVALQSAKFAVANLDPKPIGEAGSIADIQRILRDWIERKQVKPGEWVTSAGDTMIRALRNNAIRTGMTWMRFQPSIRYCLCTSPAIL